MKQFSYRPMALALATALGGLVVPAAHAAIVTSQTVGFTMSSGPATDTCGTLNATSCTAANTPSTALATASATTSFNRFNAADGVLMAVTIDLSSTRTQTVSGSVTNPAASKGNSGNGTTSTASGESGGSVSAIGAGSATLNVITHSQVSAAGSTTIALNTTGTTTNAPLTVGAGSLDAYVGAGTVAVTRQLSGVQATSAFTNGTKNSTSSTASYSVSWTGDLTMEYEYLEHALAAFDAAGTQTLNIDFGTHFVGDSVEARTFSIFNAIGANRVGLDLDSFDSFGSPFSTNLSQFFGLAAGGSSDQFDVFFNTSAAGDFSGTYTLRLSDANVGAASSRSNYSLTINLAGKVIEPANQVPEPSMLGLVGLGLMGLAVGRRRRK